MGYHAAAKKFEQAISAAGKGTPMYNWGAFLYIRIVSAVNKSKVLTLKQAEDAFRYAYTVFMWEQSGASRTSAAQVGSGASPTSAAGISDEEFSNSFKDMEMPYFKLHFLDVLWNSPYSNSKFQEEFLNDKDMAEEFHLAVGSFSSEYSEEDAKQETYAEVNAFYNDLVELYRSLLLKKGDDAQQSLDRYKETTAMIKGAFEHAKSSKKEVNFDDLVTLLNFEIKNFLIPDINQVIKANPSVQVSVKEQVILKRANLNMRNISIADRAAFLNLHNNYSQKVITPSVKPELLSSTQTVTLSPDPDLENQTKVELHDNVEEGNSLAPSSPILGASISSSSDDEFDAQLENSRKRVANVKTSPPPSPIPRKTDISLFARIYAFFYSVEQQQPFVSGCQSTVERNHGNLVCRQLVIK